MKIAIAVIGLFLVSSLVSGGNLNPPAAPAPTMKTLDEVEPRIPVGPTTTPGDAEYEYIISASGSYYLTGNFMTSKGGIKITSDDVTLDLSGYMLRGSAIPSKTANYGIYIGNYGVGWTNGQMNVEIQNGVISYFEDYGIYAPSPSSKDLRLLDLRISRNGYDGSPTAGGIYLLGDGHLIKGCTINNNGSSSAVAVYGIYAGSEDTISACTVNDNGVMAEAEVYGINAGTGSILTDNAVRRNGISTTAGNVYGIYTGGGCMIRGNTAYNNGTAAVGWVYGIYGGPGGTLAGNTSYDNGNSAQGQVFGIMGYIGCTVADNTAYYNGISGHNYVYGIYGYYGCALTGNSAADNGQSATGSRVRGIHADPGCTVIRNSAYRNGTSATGTVYGIYLSGNNLADQNIAYSNNGTNMYIPASCTTGINHAP